MVLGCGFESWLNQKIGWKDGPLEGRKSNNKDKGSQMGQATPNFFF